MEFNAQRDIDVTNLKENQVLTLAPDESLKKTVGAHTDLDKIISIEKMERAQAVVEGEKDDFLPQTLAHIAELETQCLTLYKQPENSAEILQTISFSALDIKSKAGMFGYNLATELADSLSKFAAHTTLWDQKNLTILKAHVDTLKIIFKEQITGMNHPLSSAIIEEFKKATGNL